MSDVVMSCVVCSPDLPAFTVPFTPEGLGLAMVHMSADHEGQWEHLPDDMLLHVHRPGQIERGSWQWSPARDVATGGGE